MKNSKITKEEKHWIMYDIGNSAFVLLVSTIIPIYFKNMATVSGISASDSTAFYSYAISISTIIVALLGPLLGTVADNRGYKKPLFTFFMMMGVLGCAGLSIPKIWIVFLVIFVIAKVGFSASLIFYDSMLIDVTTDERMDNISSQGYAWGYIGSCIPFLISLMLVLFSHKVGISTTAAMTVAFLLNAVWWLVVTLPLLKNYKQNYYVEKTKTPIKNSFVRLNKIWSELRNNKKILMFLIAFFFYIDGVYTIIEMATSYGKDVGITDDSMLFALLLTQIVAFPCSIIFGRLSRNIDADKLIRICIIAYFFIAVFALQLDTAWKFWMLAVLVAVFQGAIQALSRSYYAKLIPKDKASEYFGIFDIFGKGASFIGTTLMGVSTQIFDSSKAGIVVIAFMFVIGLVVFQMQYRKNNELNTEQIGAI